MSVKIMGQVYDLDLPRSQKQVLLALADHCDHEGNHAHPGIPLLAYKTEMSERQVQRQMVALLASGIVTAETGAGGGRGVKTDYSIHLEKGDKKTPFSKASKTKRVTSETIKGDICDMERVTNETTKGDISDTFAFSLYEPSLEPSLEPSKNQSGFSEPSAKTETGTATKQREDAPGVSGKSEPDKSNSGAKSAVPYPDDLIAFWKDYPARGRARSSLREAEAIWRRMTSAERVAACAGLAIALQTSQFTDYPPAVSRWLRDRRWEAFTEELLAEIAANVPARPGDKHAAGGGVYSREIADALGSVAGEDGWEPESPCGSPLVLLTDLRTDLHTERSRE